MIMGLTLMIVMRRRGMKTMMGLMMVMMMVFPFYFLPTFPFLLLSIDIYIDTPATPQESRTKL